MLILSHTHRGGGVNRYRGSGGECCRNSLLVYYFSWSRDTGCNCAAGTLPVPRRQKSAAMCNQPLLWPMSTPSMELRTFIMGQNLVRRYRGVSTASWQKLQILFSEGKIGISLMRFLHSTSVSTVLNTVCSSQDFWMLRPLVWSQMFCVLWFSRVNFATPT